MTLAGRTVALAEGRQLEDLARMLEKEGAQALRCPMLDIIDAPDDAPLLHWIDQLQADRFAWVILLTGEGLRRLLGCAGRHDRRETFLAALARTRILTRGPKPGQALKEVDLVPSLIAQAPTTDGVIASLRAVNLQHLTVGVQLYSESNPPLELFLKSAGAIPVTVQPYVYAPASAAESVVQLFQQMSDGKVDVIVFTSSPQVERLFAVGAERNLTDLLQQGLSRTTVAVVGPLVRDALQQRGVTVQICPEQGFVMKNLVQLLKRAFA